MKLPDIMTISKRKVEDTIISCRETTDKSIRVVVIFKFSAIPYLLMTYAPIAFSLMWLLFCNQALSVSPALPEIGSAWTTNLVRAAVSPSTQRIPKDSSSVPAQFFAKIFKASVHCLITA
eukprot:GHVP01043790.1.p1 GENE.GHVP01043790.1~~GHVP01043790.1.p1  ORF type:complete len:120 (+),score=0.76 GHVP01043790.1:282-641(+)